MDVLSLQLPPGQGETSIKIDFDYAIDLTLAGATVSAEIKGDAVVRLKIQEDGATAIAPIQFIDILSLKLDGAPADSTTSSTTPAWEPDAARAPSPMRSITVPRPGSVRRSPSPRRLLGLRRRPVTTKVMTSPCFTSRQPSYRSPGTNSPGSTLWTLCRGLTGRPPRPPP